MTEKIKKTDLPDNYFKNMEYMCAGIQLQDKLKLYKSKKSENRLVTVKHNIEKYYHSNRTDEVKYQVRNTYEVRQIYNYVTKHFKNLHIKHYYDEENQQKIMTSLNVEEFFGDSCSCTIDVKIKSADNIYKPIPTIVISK